VIAAAAAGPVSASRLKTIDRCANGSSAQVKAKARTPKVTSGHRRAGSKPRLGGRVRRGGGLAPYAPNCRR
jgi:hypothetical protein